MLAGTATGEVGALPHKCSPMAAISISSPQFEHLMAGMKLAGLIPPADSAAASDILQIV